jgi:hypothetical protein
MPVCASRSCTRPLGTAFGVGVRAPADAPVEAAIGPPLTAALLTAALTPVLAFAAGVGVGVPPTDAWAGCGAASGGTFGASGRPSRATETTSTVPPTATTSTTANTHGHRGRSRRWDWGGGASMVSTVDADGGGAIGSRTGAAGSAQDRVGTDSVHTGGGTSG